MPRRIAAAVAALALVVAGCLSGPAVAATSGRLVALAPSPACPDIAPATQPPGSPVRILAVGDSITAACQWQLELSRLLTAAGVPHVITSYGVGGSRCGYWPDKIGQVLAGSQPDVMVLYCGTNDDPGEMIYGETKTGWSYRYMLETAHGYRSPAPAIVPVLIGMSDWSLAPSWLLTNEAATTDNLWGQAYRYVPAYYSVQGIAAVDRMPGTEVYLDGDGCDPASSTCGVHPSAKGYRTIGRLIYDAAATTAGWPAATSIGEPVLCGMAGHRRGYPRPTYTPCPS